MKMLIISIVVLMLILFPPIQQANDTHLQQNKPTIQKFQNEKIPMIYFGEWAEKKEYCGSDGVITISDNGYGGYEYGCSLNNGQKNENRYVANFTCNENGEENASTQIFSVTTDGKLTITTEFDNNGAKQNMSNSYFKCKETSIKR